MCLVSFASTIYLCVHWGLGFGNTGYVFKPLLYCVSCLLVLLYTSAFTGVWPLEMMGMHLILLCLVTFDSAHMLLFTGV